MVSPLSPSSEASLNSATATPDFRDQGKACDVEKEDETHHAMDNSPPSSPFVPDVADTVVHRYDSPTKTRQSPRSPMAQEQTSPLKMLRSRVSPASKANSPQRQSVPSSPRKISSSEKRFPVKPFTSPEKRLEVTEKDLYIKHPALKENIGLHVASQYLDDTEGDLDRTTNGADDTFATTAAQGDDGPNMDDTMVSTFSAFSAVPDMTMFAKLGHSPTRLIRQPQISTPATARRPLNERSPSPNARGNKRTHGRDEDNTTNLLDFTDQISGFSGYGYQSPARQARQSPYKNVHNNGYYGQATPTLNRYNMSNLLDFDIPPAPTPRSLPSITPRELESLKSNFLSEISSLKASLSGKEAEASSLKTAVGDAEKRVGESLEQVREERGQKEQLAAEKEEWEKRSREMEAVMRNVKEELVNGERERQELEERLDESDRRREAAEIMAQEAETKMAGTKVGKASSPTPSTSTTPGTCSCGASVTRAVELAVDNCSRELHTLYKEKHETKVSALKKSYEQRWDKKVKKLEKTLDELSKENEELKLGRDATITKVDPKTALQVTEVLERQAVKDAKTKELEAELEGLSEVVKSVKLDNADLRRLLDEERVEKGKLVTAVDEMIPLVVAFDDMLADMNSAPAPQATPSASQLPSTQKMSVENLRGSISRASGLRAPSSVSGIAPPSESRIGRGGFGAPAGTSQERSRSGSAQHNRPGSGLSGRSGIMSSIERMGSYKGRGD